MTAPTLVSSPIVFALLGILFSFLKILLYTDLAIRPDQLF
jgi:hypothetical protein